MDTDDLVDDFGAGTSDVVDAVERVESAVMQVERAINEKTSTITTVGWMLLGIWLVVEAGDLWHGKWRYAMTYGVSTDNVVVESHPHDCAFVAAPFGEKYCHYDREVSTLRRATSTTGNPIVSYDEGKTWSVVERDPTVAWPQQSTIVIVYINWKKIEE